MKRARVPADSAPEADARCGAKAAEAAARPLRLKPRTGASLQRQSFRRASTSVAWRALFLCVCASGASARLAFSQCPDGTPPPCAGRHAASSPTSVAVLPFANLSRDSSDAYLAEGLTEEITSRLGGIERLQVSGRSVVKRAQHASEGDPIALARRLGVRYLVEGSVRRSGARLRISVRLLRATDGVWLWGSDFDRTSADLLDIQETIAVEVATGVAGRLLPAERASVTARPTTSAEAYDHLLRGNYFLAQRTAAAIERALAEYNAAMRLDPRFARAWAQTAYGYALLYFYRTPRADLPPESLLGRGFAATDRALRLDSSASDAWLPRGLLLTYRYPRDLDSALGAYRRAVALGPRNAEAWHGLGWVLGQVGDTAGARQAYFRALEIEPARPVTLLNLAQYEYWQRQPERALRWTDSALAVDPTFTSARAWRAIVWLRLGGVTRARSDADTAVRLSPTHSMVGTAALVAVSAAAGDTSAAGRHLAELLRNLTDSTAPTPWEGLWVGIAIAALGDDERTLEFLERVRPRAGQLAVFLRDPAFDHVRAHPRFERIVQESRPPVARP